MYKIKMAVFLLWTMSIMAISCTKKQSDNKSSTITIEGKVDNIVENGYLAISSIDNPDTFGTDTIKIDKDGNFKGEITTQDKGFYVVRINGLQEELIILDGHDLHIEADGGQMYGKFEVEGSDEMKSLSRIDKLNDEYYKKMYELEQGFQAVMESGDSAKIEEISTKQKQFENEFISKLKGELEAIGPSLASVAALELIPQNDENFPFLQSMAKLFENKLDEYPQATRFVEMINRMATLAIGSEAPNLELPNAEGEIVPLASLRGKYVLIDFWASWCKPCRWENPQNVALYKKYKDKGFEIYGVSLDKNKEAWINAIKEDSLSWVHVSDLKFYDSEAAQLYNVEAIPFTVLIDKEGKIIAKNLRGEELKSKLEELLKS